MQLGDAQEGLYRHIEELEAALAKTEAERDKYQGALRMIESGHIAPITLSKLALHAPNWRPLEPLPQCSGGP